VLLYTRDLLGTGATVGTLRATALQISLLLSKWDSHKFRAYHSWLLASVTDYLV